MDLRRTRTWAAIAALSVTTPALLALSASPALAGTGGGTLMCKTTTLAPPPQDAPFIVKVTANPSGPKAPTGAAIQVNNATVTVTLPGAVTGNLKAQAGAGTVGLNQGIVKLDATHASGALQVTNLSAPAQTITNYNATGGPGGTPTADPITLTMSGVNFGTLTTNGATGQLVDISMAANSSGDGFILSLGGGAIIPTLGFGSLNSGLGGPGGGGICANDTTGANGTAWTPAVASVQLVQQTFTNTAKPKITGTAKLGSTLTCKPGSWSPSPAKTAVQWLRDGKKIKKATKAKYKVVKADAKHKLSCKVTVTSPGYTTATAISKAKAVPAAKH
jgi:hypothetical protein